MNKSFCAVTCFVLSATFVSCGGKTETPEQKPGKQVKTSKDLVFEGQVTFRYYCVGCHGLYGRGDGPSAAGIYKQFKVAPRNLSNETYMNTRTDEQLSAVISKGGKHEGFSSYMPAWDLPEEKIKALVTYIRTLPSVEIPSPLKGKKALMEKGKILFLSNCSVCHGLTGKGNGPYVTKELSKDPSSPKPPDFTDAVYMQTLSDQTLVNTISGGGAHMGKSEIMPMWTGKLNEEQIQSVAVYIRSLASGN